VSLGSPRWTLRHINLEANITVSGSWTVEQASTMEIAVSDIIDAIKQESRVVFDLSQIEHLDTTGAWLLDRTRHDLASQGYAVTFANAREEHRILLDEVDHYERHPQQEAVPRFLGGIRAQSR
jgi:phospholipid/cholesterol/gamma-HCH transport system permease protein